VEDGEKMKKGGSGSTPNEGVGERKNLRKTTHPKDETLNKIS